MATDESTAIANKQAASDIETFYNTLSTIPKLIGDMGMDIAEAQRRLDHNYIENLAAFTNAVRKTFGKDLTVGQYLDLFKAMAPSRYQFTETDIEVRADLQTAKASELNVGVQAGIKTGVFSVAVNASFMKRSATDYQAAAVIRTVLNAIPADPNVLDKLLKNAGPPPTAALEDPRYQALMNAFSKLLPEEPLHSPPHF
jgi:hypothetical protein